MLPTNDRPMAAQVDFFHGALAQWLTDQDITVACGRWADGAISELMPMGRAELLEARYDGCFTGVRELRMAGSPHHLHVDFGRVHRLSYAVAPSVCLAFKPSFEVRMLLLGPGNQPSDRWMVSLMLSAPYRDETLDCIAVRRFFAMAQRHARERPDLVELKVEPSVQSGVLGPQILEILRSVFDLPDAAWIDITRAMAHEGPVPTAPIEPDCLPLLQDGLALADASLVIFRDRTLIEFKTERLQGISSYNEQGHVSWQIGAQEDHHCHLDLLAVVRVRFSAEPVSCQGGGINYTIWFLTAGSAGNPYRRDGYFSIVLNRPYCGNRPRMEVIVPMLDLYRRFQSCPWVTADEGFLDAITAGPQPRRSLNGSADATA